MIHLTCLRYTGRSSVECDDLFQDVFMALFEDNGRVLESLDFSRSKLSTFIAIIVRNKTINMLRSVKKTISIDDIPEAEDEMNSFGELFDAFDRQDQLDRALCGLTPNERLFFQLYFRDMAEPEQVAQVMGIGVDTVYSKKAKLIQRLKSLVAV